MSYYGDNDPKQLIRDGILWHTDNIYSEDDEGRKKLAADIAQVCSDLIAELLGYGYL